MIVSKKSACFMLVAVATAVSLSPIPLPAQTKNVAVVSVKGVNGLMADIAYLTEAAGMEDAGRMAMMMSQQFTQGVDGTQPIAIVASTDGQQFPVVGFLPIGDLETKLGMFAAQIGTPRDMGNGIKELSSLPQPVYFKQGATWAYVSNSDASLSNVPETPEQALGELSNDYDIAIRAHVSNVPMPLKQFALGQMKAGLEMQLQQQGDVSDAQRQLVAAQMKQMDQMIGEIDQITLGLNVDEVSKKVFLDVEVTAVPNSDLASQLAYSKDATTSFVGFRGDDSAISFAMANKLPADQLAPTMAAIDGMKTALLQEMQTDGNFPNAETQKLAEEVVGDVIEILKETLQSGKLDGVGSAQLANEASSAIVAGYVADGSKVESLLKKLADVAKSDPDFPGITFNADNHDGTQFHTMSVPIPDGEEARKVFGDQLDLVIGTGAESFCLGVGNDCLSQIKDAMDRSKSASDTVVAPVEITVSAAKIMGLAASLTEDASVQAVAQTLAAATGSDHVIIAANHVANGVRYRYEIQDGIVRAIGQAISASRSR